MSYCKGFTRGSPASPSRRCLRPAFFNVPGTDYCRHHGPKGSNNTSTDPKEFRLEDCRSVMGPSAELSTTKQWEQLKQDVRKSQNIVENLNFTTVELNLNKFEWMDTFMTDYKGDK
eukprot:gene28472-31621_t